MKNWVTILIGIITITVSLILYLRSRTGPRLSYQYRSIRLIGGEDQELPNNVKVMYNRRQVPLLSKTQIILWNSGKAMLEGRNITPLDPLQILFENECEILNAAIIKQSREPNDFKVILNQDSLNQVKFQFDYLNPQDGAVIEILHTGEHSDFQISGSIRGVSKDTKGYGKIPYERPVKKEKVRVKIKRGLSVLLIFFGCILIPNSILILGNRDIFSEVTISSNKTAGWFMISLGIVYSIIGCYFFFSRRRRFPRNLSVEDTQL